MNPIRRPSPFVLLASGHGTFIINRNDYHILDEQRGYGVGFQLLNTSYFDPEEVNLVMNFLQMRKEFFGHGVIAIDCGANIGVHTVEWGKLMYGWGNVIAFEAQERIYYALAGNIAINNCLNASAHHAALGAQVGALNIPEPNYNLPASFGSLELRKSDTNEYIGQSIDYSDEKMKSVRMLTIDSFSLNRIDFMKIDVEGMELEVLSGAMNSIEKCKPQMLIESIKTNKSELVRLLANLDYVTYQFGINILAIHKADPSLQRLAATV